MSSGDRIAEQIWELVDEYVDAKRAAGYSYDTSEKVLHQMTRFLLRRGMDGVRITEDDLDAWVNRTETRKGKGMRFQTMDGFSAFLEMKGYPTYRGEWRTYDFGREFKARILDDEELSSLFSAADDLRNH
ncbi:MAG: hypothetical protein PUD02_06585 [Eggerthellales bacterium]|nr:hypothetical protein [Eggerthellales bacterium]